jgi:hypothetical protein
MMRMPTSKTKEVCQAPPKKKCASESVGRKILFFDVILSRQQTKYMLWVGRKEHSTASAIR